MLKKLRNRHFLLLDLLFLPLSAYLSYVLRLEQYSLQQNGMGLLVFSLISTAITIFIFYWLGVYSRYWLFASIDELLLLGSSVFIAALVSAGISWMLVRQFQTELVIPRSIPFIFFFLALSLTALPRLTLRLIQRRFAQQVNVGPGKKILIVGAGNAGELAVRELKKNNGQLRTLVGFIDDDPLKHHMHIHGLPVLGGRNDIPRLVKEHEIQQVVIAMPTAPGKEIRKIVQICEKIGIHAQILPNFSEVLEGKVLVSQIRNVEIEDLLRREPVKINISEVSKLIQNKRILVTGSGGSIGSELCRQIIQCRPAELVLVGHGENSIFQIQNELQTLMEPSADGSPMLTCYIADIRFRERIEAIFQEVRPHLVFHAAAHKHVPLMELNPSEAVENNIIGTRHLLNASLRTGVDCFVMISTDKAVNPTSIMGASKRTAEMLVHQAARRSGRPFVTVRFGNVLGSRGSVVLTFKQQIAAGGPVTVTHPEMKRYFMTIPEAVRLVLQASVLGKGGEVFVLNMGEPVKIMDLARDLIELSGLKVGRDIDIVHTGIRPGEKLYEELFAPNEHYNRTPHQQIFIAENASSFVGPDLDAQVDALEVAAKYNDRAAIVRCFKNLIPEYRPLSNKIIEESAKSSKQKAKSGAFGLAAHQIR